MPWNPDVYNKFKNIRYQPFFDLMDLIADQGAMQCIDLGCGTGEQTYILADRFKTSTFLGIDASAEMLSKSVDFEHDRLQFVQATTEDLVDGGSGYDMIFSNAALQWSDHHEQLFPQLINLLNKNGQFAVQMPVQHENILNKLLLDLVQEEPFCTYLNGWKRTSPLLSIDEYTSILFEAGLQDLQVIQKVYPIIAHDYQTLFDFISGSALIPYMERLSGSEKEFFIQTYKERIAAAFPKLPAIYAFKRLLLYGRKK